MTNETAISEIRNMEEMRVNALLNADWVALGNVLGDDLVHYHANGDLDDKPTYIKNVSTKLEFLKIERPSLTIRIFGDVAIVSGRLNQEVRVKGPGTVMEFQGNAIQTWVKQSGKWLQNTYLASRIG